MERKFLCLLLLIGLVLPVVSAYTDSVYIGDYEVSVQYEDAIADDVFSLMVELANDDDETHNLTLEFDSDDPFEFISDEDWTIEIESGESVSKTFRIEVDDDADSKSYDLDFNLEDEDDDWDDSLKIRVNSNSADLVLGEIVSSPKKILPGGEDVELEITVKNKGDKDAEDLVATLVLPNGFIASSSYSDTAHVGDLESGESETLTFYFDVEEDISDKDYSASLNLEYEVDGDDENLNLVVELPVFPVPQFEISQVSVLSDKIYVGSGSKVQIFVRNVGGEDAEDVSLKVYERSDQPFEFVEKSYYIGSLGVGQTGSAIFEFDVEKGANPSDYLLDFQVRGVSGSSVIVDDLTGGFHVTEKEFNLADYWIVGLVGIIILVILIIILIRRV